MFAENPAVFLRDFGLPCVAGGHRFLALDDLPDQVIELAGVPVRTSLRQLTVAAADVTAAGLATGSSVVVEGRSRTVREVLALDDGAFFHVTYST